VHIVILGCGRVGAALARSLEHQGHSVAIVDRNVDAFRRLSTEFSGRQVAGVGFDQDVLVEAGIREAGAFAAVSSGDNSNIIAARVARETFGVQTVVARIYDPRRAEVYQRLGIPTVATVRWTADQVLRRLLPEGVHSEWADPSGRLLLVEVGYDDNWIGVPLGRIAEVTGARIAFVTRLGEAMLPGAAQVVQEGDLIHLLAQRDRLDEITAVLAKPPPREDR
jgi:trk system potassium uptake protein TrkA